MVMLAGGLPGKGQQGLDRHELVNAGTPAAPGQTSSLAPHPLGFGRDVTDWRP